MSSKQHVLIIARDISQIINMNFFVDTHFHLYLPYVENRDFNLNSNETLHNIKDIWSFQSTSKLDYDYDQLNSIIYSHSLFRHRRYSDSQVDNYNVYQHVRYWKDKFDNDSISVVINLIGFGGEIWDIPQLIAEQNNITVIELMAVFDKYFVFYNSKLKTYILNQHHEVTSLDQISISNTDHTFFLRRYESLGKFLGLVLGIIAKIIGMWRFEVLHSFFRPLFGYENQLSIRSIRLQRKFDYIHYKNYISLYNKLTKEIDQTKRLIYFPLHLEPEGTLFNKTYYIGQLFWIRRISEVLPANYQLVVKEHPVMKYLNNHIYFHYQRNLSFFKSLSFLREISKLNNVIIADLSIPAEEIIGICDYTTTIMGSVVIESLLMKKNVVLLEGSKSVYSKLSSVLDFEQFVDNVKNNREANDLHDDVENEIESLVKKYFHFNDKLDLKFALKQENGYGVDKN